MSRCVSLIRSSKNHCLLSSARVLLWRAAQAGLTTFQYPGFNVILLPPPLRDLREASDPTGKALHKASVFLVVPVNKEWEELWPHQNQSAWQSRLKTLQEVTKTPDDCLVRWFVLFFFKTYRTSFPQAIYSYLSTKRWTSFTFVKCSSLQVIHGQCLILPPYSHKTQTWVLTWVPVSVLKSNCTHARAAIRN